MNGKIAVVSGAAQGIGAAVAEALIQRGATVAALDILADQLATSASRHPGRLHPYALDLRAGSAVEKAVETIEAKLGPIDMLVNVAGILRMGNIVDLSDEDWASTFAINTHAVFHLSSAVARRMIPRARGSIVTVGSNAAGIPRLQMAAYAASKAASCHFTKCLGLELAAYGIRCNIVSPGSTDTAMQRQFWRSENDAQKVIEGSLSSYRTGIPLRRIAAPEDIASAVVFLLGDDARHITMHDLCVDGGATLGV